MQPFLVFDATYENCVLKPAQPIPLEEHELVRVTIESVTGWAECTAGILKWRPSRNPATHR